jgi:hypothetical protein
MTAQNPAFCIQADAHSAELFRRAVTSLMGGVTNTTPGGVVATTDLAVTAGSGNSVNVATGEVWIPGSSASHMGAFYGYNDATVNLGITPNASNPLYAIITASVNDQAYTGNPGVTNNTWNLLVTQGTPAPSPSVPSTPSNSILLAQVLVPANAASSASYTITDKRVLANIGNSNGMPMRGNPAATLGAGIITAIPTGVGLTAIDTSSSVYLRGGMLNATGANGLQVPVTGVYAVSGACTFNTSGTGVFTVQINGNGSKVSSVQANLGGAAPGLGVPERHVLLTAGTNLQLLASQTTGGTVNNYADTTLVWLTAHLVSV